jgi:hypothetical protein
MYCTVYTHFLDCCVLKHSSSPAPTFPLSQLINTHSQIMINWGYFSEFCLSYCSLFLLWECILFVMLVPLHIVPLNLSYLSHACLTFQRSYRNLGRPGIIKNSPWAGIKLFPAGESWLVTSRLAGDGKIAHLFLQCTPSELPVLTYKYKNVNYLLDLLYNRHAYSLFSEHLY